MIIKVNNMLVRKLQDDFDYIQTGLTEENLTKNQRQKLTTLHNKYGVTFEQLNDTVWVINNYDVLVAKIKRDYPNIASARMYLEALANILLSIDKHAFKEIANELFKSGIDMQKKITVAKAHQEATPKELENFIPYEALKKIYDDMGEPIGIHDHMTKLILGFNLLWAPMRHDILTLKYMKGGDVIPTDDNYIWRHRNSLEGKLWTININHDKVGKSKGPLYVNLKDAVTHHERVQYLHGTALSNLLSKSFKVLPRKYLLCSLNDVTKPMQKSVYNSLLKQVTGKDVKQSLLRKIYINWFYNIKKVTRMEKCEVAGLMRHSLDSAMGNYIKVDFEE